jgi:hypothetical protein
MIDEGQSGGARGEALPAGIRSLEGLDAVEATRFGPEMVALAQLDAAGLPMASGHLVRLAEAPGERIAAALRLTLEAGSVARMRPVFPSDDAWARFGKGVGVPQDVSADDDLDARAAQLVEDLRGVFGAGALALGVRVLACEREPCGRAFSADTAQGDPDELGVWARGEPASRWRIDRRTLRVTQRGGGVDAMDASAVADLADRAQLALGRPVEIEWASHGRRFVVVGVRELELPPSVGVGSWRRVALMAADEGTVAALAVDALDVALRGDTTSVDPVVRRIFARPYRRMDPSVPRFRRLGAAASLARAGVRASRVVSDIASPVAAARRFHRATRERLPVLDATRLETLPNRVLIESIRERHALVAEAFALLDRGREATGAALSALEAVAGPLPPTTIGVLAAPRPGRGRMRHGAELRRLADDVIAAHGQPVSDPGHLRSDLRARFSGLRDALADVRPLGIDVRPDAIGASDRTLCEALRASPEAEAFPPEGVRRNAARQVIARAAARPLGRAREVMAAPLLLLLSRVVRAKGAVADDLAAALLRLRRAARVAGERLVDQGVLEAPEDALQLQLSEIEEALSGEPGAYAARARLRREDDARWARYQAPRRLEGGKLGTD